MSHILLISRCPPYPLHFGDRLIIYHLARELSRRGHTIDLLAFAQRPEDHHQQAHYADYFAHITLIDEPRRPSHAYLKRVVLPSTRFPKNAGQSWSPQMWRAIEDRRAAHDYDVAHLFGGVQVYEFYHALGALPAIIVPYESFSLYLRRLIEAKHKGGGQGRARYVPTNIVDSLRYLVARHFERWMFEPYQRTIVVADPDRAELHTLNPALAVEVIPNGIDLMFFQATDDARDSCTLLFTGNYEYAPNEDAALFLAGDMLPRIREQIPDAKLLLVGNAPTPAMQALQNDHISVTGRVPDVRPYLARATIFVSPLRLGAGIKNKTLEALAMGCPVVATPLSVDGIAVRDGYDSRIADEEAMADAVVQLLRDTALQRQFSANGRALIETHYTWSSVADRYEAVYAQVTN
ncbi:MAG: glycosyltransferase [Chloroflexi bacterium]|nr:MAG: glycosyltransferase [Chloroflexota bacterium]